MATTDDLRTRKSGRKLRVTLPDERVICYANVTDTFVEALSSLSPEQIQNITLQLCHLPIVSQEIYPSYRKYMKPLNNGWYVNTQSDTSQKYLQLKSIFEQLGVNAKIELGSDFETEKKIVKKVKSAKSNLLIKLPNGEFIAERNSVDTFLAALWEMNPAAIMRKELDYKGRKLMTTRKTYIDQLQVDSDIWVTVPNSTKEKYKLLVMLSNLMRIDMEITII